MGTVWARALNFLQEVFKMSCLPHETLTGVLARPWYPARFADQDAMARNFTQPIGQCHSGFQSPGKARNVIGIVVSSDNQRVVSVTPLDIDAKG